MSSRVGERVKKLNEISQFSLSHEHNGREKSRITDESYNSDNINHDESINDKESNMKKSLRQGS